MFCEKCGKKLEDGVKFCPSCGNRVEIPENQTDTVHEQPEKSKKSRKKSKLPLVLIAVLAIILIVGGILYGTVGLNLQKDKLAVKIKKAGIPQYTEEMNEIVDEWDDFGIFSISDKRNDLHKLKKIVNYLDEYNAAADEYKSMNKEKEQYALDEDSYKEYENALHDCSDAIEQKNPESLINAVEIAKETLKDLKKADDSYVEDRVKMYEGLDLKDAGDDVVSGYKKNLKEIQDLTGKGKKDYKAIKEAFSKMDQIVYQYIEPKNQAVVSIQQIDASEFPTVKLYMSIKDKTTGNVIENLDDAFFYINKQDANAKYVKQVVKSANQLNEKEALKVDMVADVSGSMDGSPLNEAKQVMSDFVGSVQFDAGDLVELTSFSTGVCLEQEFSDDAATLTNDINNLVTGDMTSLYDALYTAVERVAAQNGARCVIAFTDGNDNYSNCTKEDVVNVANRYHVPVFIIGIGSIDYADVNDIATQTGGMYYNVSDVISMDKIYEEIYQMEKQLYLVEFEDNTGATVGDTANIQAGYHSIDYGGECEYTYTPNVLMSAQSRDIYTDGPQAAVEGYLKNFDSAMNKSDFSLISGYLKNGSPIYTEQEKYVLRDITERLDSYELTDVSYADANNCVISTRETYYVQVKGKPLQLMTQECKYNVENQGDKWQLTSFADIKVVSRIKQ